MVPKPPTSEIQALIERSAAARRNLGVGVSQLREKLDAPARVREAILAHPGRWLAGAGVSGWVVSRLMFRKSRAVRTKGPRSIPLALLGLVTNAAMPAVKIWLLAQIKNFLASRARSHRQPPVP